MKKFLMALAVLAIASAPAFAGPNEGGVLVVHDTGMIYSAGTIDYPNAPPADCAAVDNEAGYGDQTEGNSIVWKIYALFPLTSSPRLKGIAIGEGISSNGGGGVVVTTGGLIDPVADFEVPQNGWPNTNGGGDGIALGHTQTATTVALYWFGGYGYAGTAGETQAFAVTPHPVQATFFVDDAEVPNTDPVVGYGYLGFGAPGTTPCPGVQPGACCFSNGDCQVIAPDACAAAGGTFYGGDCVAGLCAVIFTGACCHADGSCDVIEAAACAGVGGVYQGDNVPCTPTLCGVIPTLQRSWGQIKANFR